MLPTPPFTGQPAVALGRFERSQLYEAFKKLDVENEGKITAATLQAVRPRWPCESRLGSELQEQDVSRERA